MEISIQYKVRARFSRYDKTGIKYGIPPYPLYLILESDNPAIAQFSNVDGETLLHYRVGLPMTPIYKNWLEMGSPIYRGEENDSTKK